MLRNQIFILKQKKKNTVHSSASLLCADGANHSTLKKNLYSSTHQDMIDTILLTVTSHPLVFSVIVNKIVSILSWCTLEYRFFDLLLKLKAFSGMR